jgi:dihydropyrimidinase
MEVAAGNGGMVLVHAENGDVIDTLVKRAVREGKTEPIWHARTRPPETEAEATNRAIQLAHIAGCPLYIVHVSCREALEPVALARQRDWVVSAETCTHYLFIDETALEAPGFEGAKVVYTPPPRPKENQEYLWNGLASDELSVVSTDHSPWNFDGQKSIGRDSFALIPNGGPGIENRLHMLYHFGVSAGRLTLNRFVELVATNPAKLFGLYPRKGTIAPGSDADIVVWNPQRSLTISAATVHSKVDYNLFEGTEVQGAPEWVFAKGQCLIADGAFVGDEARGEFVKRARFGQRLERGGL